MINNIYIMINNIHKESQTYVIPSTFTPMPLANCLRRLGISLTLRRKIKHHGRVYIDDTPAAWDSLVYPNSLIRLEWDVASDIMPENIPLQIIYEDDWLLVIDKPAGMLIHPTTQQPGGTLANAVVYYYCQKGLTHAFHPVQRLDRNTSGLLVVAKLSSVHHALNKRHLRRQYLAIAEGKPQPPEATINLPIARDPNSIILRRIHPSGQEAITHYKTLQSFDSACLLQIELMTGRTHQIRLHLSAIGHPLFGDDLYGGSVDLIQRQALHSAFLEFTHPMTGAQLSFSSPLPEDMSRLLDMLQSVLIPSRRE